MKMVDVGKKRATLREAIVRGKVFLKPDVITSIKEKKLVKGDCLEAAKIAGIFAAKNTSCIIPLCHPIGIEYANIEFELGKNYVTVTSMVRSEAKTGVEMEAFCATAAATLTIYDMCKSLDRSGTISEIRLIKKSGGKSGLYERQD